METPAPTFVRRDGQILAFYEGQLIAHGTNYAKVEESAVDYLDKVDAHLKQKSSDRTRAAATHIEGPNGLKGEILGNYDGQWGEEVTVRWENGRITRHAAHADNLTYKTADEEPRGSALEYLESTLNEVPEGTKESLANRITVLDGLVVKANAAQRVSSSYEDSRKYDNISLQAQHEKREVQEALAHLEASDAEAFEPPAPFHAGAVDQASLGGGGGTWLDAVSDEMVREASEQDYDRLLVDGPAEFVAGLDTAILAEAGTTRNLAHDYISSKTAGIEAIGRGGVEQLQNMQQMLNPGAQPPQGPAPTPMAAPPNAPVPPGVAPPGQPGPAGSNPALQGLQGQVPGQPPLPGQPQVPGRIMGSVEDYHDSFLAKVEQARRDELKDRLRAAKKTAKQEKKAAKEENDDFPDEALFA